MDGDFLGLGAGRIFGTANPRSHIELMQGTLLRYTLPARAPRDPWRQYAGICLEYS